MTFTVLVPYRPDGAERERNWNFLHLWWWAVDTAIWTGDSGDQEFSPGRSVNDAAQKAGNWTVAVVTDADLLPGTIDQVHEAIELAERTRGYVCLHDSFHYLSDEGTKAVIAGAHPRDVEESEPPIARTGEKPYAIHRALWDAIGGYDPRFEGYGFNGVAIASAAATVGHATRVAGSVYHLDHPLLDRESSPHFEKNRQLGERYLAAQHRARAMQRLLSERRTSR